MFFKRKIAFEIAWTALAFCFCVLSVASFFLDRILFYVVLGFTAIVVVLCTVRIVSIRRSFASLFTGFGTGTVQHSVLATMTSPVVITDAGGSVLWYNDAFRFALLGERDIYLEDIKKTVAGFQAADCMEVQGSGYLVGEKHFTVCANCAKHGDGVVFISFFHDDTILYRDAERYHMSRPSVLLLTVDSYEELSSQMSEGSRAAILTEIYRAMEDFINTTNGIFARLSDHNYLAIIEEQHMVDIIENRFPLLDTVRAIPSAGVPVSMSIGVGRGAKTLYENQIQARKALDMALGRGGDQAALKTRGGYEFFGGVNRAVERRNKVKSRIIASALVELVHAAGNVIVMGHKNSDLDALGAAVGVARFAEICGTRANIVIDKRTTMAGPLLREFEQAGKSEWFLSPTECLDEIDDTTLLVVVDCHTPGQMETSEALKYTKNIVIIDHHRKMVDYISNSVLSYHEPYSSSCSELVTELVQHVESEYNDHLTPLEAMGLLSGIMLDTKDFTVQTGVRTFEAASYLRRIGADTTQAKLFFATDITSYRTRANLVSSAELYRGCAIALTETLPETMRVVIPQAANELLMIDGTCASIVAVRFGNQVNISARSYGKYNVQLIMEKLGGGGHQTMAGVQLTDLTMDEARDKIYSAVDSYLEDMAKSMSITKGENKS